ncbi:MAG TPA: serine hydrolase domain-containing protein [Candidatus Acidoferrum sp.]|nr:serine hydrolase domain-containing protein [Candidatus Acidoferrum sp.]
MRRHCAGFHVSLFALLSVLLPLALYAQKKLEPAPPTTLEELQKAIKTELDKNHVPGAGVALISRGELLWCGGFGDADIASKKPITCDTEFRVGSISKSFVALALLKLQEEGKINLEARLHDVAPEIPMKNAWESAHPVRIVNLLEHTAGFDDMEAAEVYNVRDPYDYPLLEVFKRFQEPQIVRWQPGTRMSYSNPGYGIAGYLIEKITGEPYDKYIRDTFLQPLGIINADYRFTDANKALLASGYDGKTTKPVGYPYIYLRPAGDLKASPGELAKLVQFFLRRGMVGQTQLLAPELIVRMETPKTSSASQHGLRLGYGLANYTGVAGGILTHGHDGGIDGFISSCRYMPEQNWGYVALLNSAGSGEALENINRLAIEFLSKDYPKPYKPVNALAPAELQSLAGFYAQRAPRSQMLSFLDELAGGIRIRTIGGQLTRSSLFGKPQPLLPAGKNLFRAEKEPEGTTLFFADESGHMAFTSMGDDAVSYAVRTSPLWPYARVALLALCAVLMLSSVAFAVIWLVRKLIGKMKGVQHLSVRAVPLFAVLSLVAIPFCFNALHGSAIGTPNMFTIGIYMATILFALLSLLGLVLALRVPKAEIHRGVRIHSLLVSLACCAVALFFASWGLIGLRLWVAQ